MLTDAAIEEAKKGASHLHTAHHEHNDCIRLACEWLDAQNTVKVGKKRYLPLKHIIEKWAGRYVSQSDVEVAAAMHPQILGKYPNYNLSTRLVLPHDRRLNGIGEALSQDQRSEMDVKTYASLEL